MSAVNNESVYSVKGNSDRVRGYTGDKLVGLRG